MSKQLEQLKSAAQPFLILNSRKRDVSTLALMEDVPRSGVVRIIRGQKCRSVQGFFDEFSAAMQFPYYFGHNWDAFEECINDLSWLPSEEYLLVITDSDQLMYTEPTKQLSMLLSILGRAAKRWSSGFNYEKRNRVQSKVDGKQKSKFSVIFQIENNAETASPFMNLQKNMDVPLIELPPLDSVR